jgi:hypothetical protein
MRVKNCESARYLSRYARLGLARPVTADAIWGMMPLHSQTRFGNWKSRMCGKTWRATHIKSRVSGRLDTVFGPKSSSYPQTVRNCTDFPERDSVNLTLDLAFVISQRKQMGPASQDLQLYYGIPPESHVPRCPKCRCSDVRRSTRRSLIDAILEHVSVIPYRCRYCRCRFHRRESDRSRKCLEIDAIDLRREPASHGFGPIRNA